MSAQPRALMPDYLRLIALFGIVVVNVQFIAFSQMGSLIAPKATGWADAVTLWLVNGLALFKTFGLFSFMFGVGLGLLLRAAQRRDLAFGRLYRNRMWALAALGLLHGCLFFAGDILVTYALMGAILYRLRDWPLARLVRLGAGLIVAQSLIAPALIMAIPASPPDLAAAEMAVMTAGSWGDVVALRAMSYAVSLPFLLLTQGIAALGWFCLGLAAVRGGLIDRADHPLWAQARRWCLGPGVLASLGAAALWQWGAPMAGAALTLVLAPIASLGYLGVIAAIARPRGPLMTGVLNAGGASLSIYLGQSIILSSLFAPYGLGLWGALDRASATLIALAVTVALVAALALWRRIFTLGPFEWLLRRLTYAGQVRADL